MSWGSSSCPAEKLGEGVKQEIDDMVHVFEERLEEGEGGGALRVQRMLLRVIG